MRSSGCGFGLYLSTECKHFDYSRVCRRMGTAELSMFVEKDFLRFSFNLNSWLRPVLGKGLFRSRDLALWLRRQASCFAVDFFCYALQGRFARESLSLKNAWILSFKNTKAFGRHLISHLFKATKQALLTVNVRIAKEAFKAAIAYLAAQFNAKVELFFFSSVKFAAQLTCTSTFLPERSDETLAWYCDTDCRKSLVNTLAYPSLKRCFCHMTFTLCVKYWSQVITLSRYSIRPLLTNSNKHK